MRAAAERLDGRCRLPAGRLATNPPHAAAAADRRDRQTDGHRTVTQTLPHAMRVVSIMYFGRRRAECRAAKQTEAEFCREDFVIHRLK